MAVISIVESDAIFAMDLKIALKEQGYEVCSIAHDYDEALRAARKSEPNYILLDIDLTGDIDGIHTAGLIQETAKTEIIFISCMPKDFYNGRLAQIKYLDYLQKPVDEYKLFKLLKMRRSNEKYI